MTNQSKERLSAGRHSHVHPAFQGALNAMAPMSIEMADVSDADEFTADELLEAISNYGCEPRRNPTGEVYLASSMTVTEEA